ncbi:MAG TPA: hypothetical protein VNI77_12365 [Nitrososphaera sp.]|nr:hypothetical protein [Nitrososphaera sp.]
MVKSFESAFNHTMTYKMTRRYSDDMHRYSCNFSYNGNYYGLSMKFNSLRFLTAYSRFTAISIPDGLTLIGGSFKPVAMSSNEDSTKIIRAIYPFNALFFGLTTVIIQSRCK